MPEMPDPISTCPILDRLALRAVDSTWLRRFRNDLAGGDLLNVALRHQIVLRGVGRSQWQCWLPGDPTNVQVKSEFEWLDDYFFSPVADGWWKTLKGGRTWKDEVKDKIVQTADLALQQSSVPPVRVVWVCAGPALAFQGPDLVTVPSPHARLLILTPPPERICEPI